MKKYLKDYLHYSQTEKRGVFILLILIIGGILYPTVHSKFQKEQTVDYSEYQEKIDKFLVFKDDQTIEPQVALPVLFTFDPNTLDKSGFLELGLSEKISNTIINYRSSGGEFKKATDFQKIYGLTNDEFKRLKPYISIVVLDKPIVNDPESEHIALNANEGQALETLSVPKNSSKIDLNTADSIELITVSGIGPVFAGRILNYRNYLGGYARLVQLNEVFGFTPEMYDNLSKHFEIDSSKLIPININQASFKLVNKHPYISYKQTKSIFKYRDLMGEFSSLNDLLENHLIDSVTFFKVEPYLSLH